MALQSLDIGQTLGHDNSVADIREPSGGRDVAKLIDTTKCIGCKACRCLHGMERSARRDRHDIGQYQNPHDLSANTWTLMRFAELRIQRIWNG